MTGLDLVTAAFEEVNILGNGEVLTPEDAAFGLKKLNRIYDNWNAERQATWADVISSFTLTAALSPHTIGPSGATWTVTQRPVSIEGINIVVSGVRTPVRPRDFRWYVAQGVPATAMAYPTDFYYEAAWTLGKVYFYGVPSAAYTVELQIRQLLAAFTLVLDVTLPPGYQDALTLTLAENLASAYPGAVVTPQLTKDATAARARLFANNTRPPRLQTCDAGMPGGRGGTYNYLTGRLE